ncbi:hypothetical protein PFISCL1PPCAC_11636, partial [Pristionchus fissidentatus]
DDDEVRFHPTVNFNGIHSSALKLALKWCEKHKGETSTTELIKDASKIPKMDEWDRQFLNIDTPVLISLLKAANTMEIKSLIDMGCKAIADLIKGKSTDEMREIFNLENDFTPEEEESIRLKHER